MEPFILKWLRMVHPTRLSEWIGLNCLNGTVYFKMVANDLVQLNIKKDELYSSSFLQLFLIFIDYQFVRYTKSAHH